MKFNIFIISVLVLLCTGCYEEFDINPEAQVRMCMIGNVNAGKQVSVRVRLSSTWNDDSPCLIDTADLRVELFVNGQFTENLKINSVYRYKQPYTVEHIELNSQYCPKEGDHVEVVASCKNYGEVRGETEIPKAIKIRSVACKLKSCKYLTSSELPKFEKLNDSTAFFNVELDVDVEFQDPQGVANYYSLIGVYSQPITGNIVSDDPIFYEYLNPIDESICKYSPLLILGGNSRFSYFSDNSIDGQIKKISMSYHCIHYALNKKTATPDLFQVNLSSVTKETFDAELSIWNNRFSYKNQLSEAGLGEYIWLVSNVSTSGGYIRGVSTDKQSVDIDSIVRKYYIETVKR